MSYFKKHRASIYPQIKDWSAPNNHLRHERHKKLADLIFFSPFMYKFLKVGLYGYFLLACMFLDYLVSGGVFQYVIYALYVIIGYKGIKEYWDLRNTDINMYDMMLRDY
jgi:hypothetical protein